jgi:hypothetical protein
MPFDRASEAMAESLRSQMSERVKGQHQVVVLAAAVAAASLSFGTENLSRHPEVLALLCLLFVGLALAALRHDQEIAIMAKHLRDENAFGPDAQAQSRWERHKFEAMQGSGVVALVASGSQTMGVYGVPVLGIVAFGWAAIASSPTMLTWMILIAASVFTALFVVGAIDIVVRYRDLGDDQQAPATS